MLRSLMSFVLVLGALTLLQAQEKKEDKKDKQPIKGRWVKEAEGIELMFDFKTKDELLLKASAGGNGVTITCKYTYDEKEKKVSAEVTEVKEEGEFPAKPPKGYKFKFVFKITDDSAKLSDYEADNAEEVKPIIEGTYKMKKPD